MIDPKEAYPQGSIINLIARQNLLSLRQKSADAFFDEKAKEVIIESGKYKRKRIPSTLHKAKSVKKSRKQEFWIDESTDSHIPNAVIKELKDKLIFDFITMGEVSKEWLPKEGANNRVSIPKSQKEFARLAGINEGHYKQVEMGEVPISLDDAVKICRAYNIDLAKFLTPPLENLEEDLYFDLLPIHPSAGPTYMYQWIMWIHGYKELPGQDQKEFCSSTALPAPFNYGVHGGRERDYDLRQAELKRIKESELNAASILNEFIEKKKSKILNSPYLKLEKRIALDEKISFNIIRSTIKIATGTKVLFRTDNGATGLKRLHSRFINRLSIIRENIVFILTKLLAIKK